MADSDRMSAGQPIFLLTEDAERTQGRDAQSANIDAGRAVAEAVRTTLGPNGMDKMLVSDSDVVVTNDGATILDEMDIEHPAAKMIVEVAEAQEDEVGDGTTTAATLVGELLSGAEDLLDDDVHPTTIVEGYARARDIAEEAVEATTLDVDLDDEVLANVAVSSMTGKGTGNVPAERLAESVVEAVRRAATDDGVDRDRVHVVTQAGRSSTATELVEGIVADMEPVRDDMPRSVEDASVLVLDAALENRSTEADVEYNVTSADQLSAALEAEDRELQEYADALIDAGVDVAFVTDDVADVVAGRLSNAGVLVFDGVSDSDARSIAQATGASQLGSVDDVEADDLGVATSVRIERFGDEELAFVEGGAEATSITLFVRGGTGQVIDELERAVTDGVDAVAAALDAGGVVPGAGAAEIAIAEAVRDEAAGIEGRQQLAVEAFADAVEVIPRTLAQNAGMDPIDALVDLRARNESGHAGVIGSGQSGAVDDPVGHGVLDPAAVKREALRSATEAATMIVRIDDVISAQ